MSLGERTDPVAGFRFGVEIQGIVVGWFTECSGLAVEREVLPYQEGGVNDYVHQLPGQVKRANVQLKRGIADGVLWDWFQQGAYDGQVTRRNVSIVLFNGDYSEAQRWELPEAYPLKWSGSALRASGREVAVETLEIGQRGGESQASTVQRAVAGAELLAEGSTGQESAGQEVDLSALAQALYHLMRVEATVERERLGRSQFR